MAKAQADKAAEYASYAEHCLKIAQILPDQESRIVHREMAAEWIKLAGDAADQDATQSSASDHRVKRTDHG